MWSMKGRGSLLGLCLVKEGDDGSYVQHPTKHHNPVNPRLPGRYSHSYDHEVIMEPSIKRRRVERSPSPTYKLDDEDDSYVPYVPVARRRQEKIARLTARGGASQPDRKSAEQDDRDAEMLEEERKREEERLQRTLLMEAQDVHSKKAAQGMSSRDYITPPEANS